MTELSPTAQACRAALEATGWATGCIKTAAAVLGHPASR